MDPMMVASAILLANEEGWEPAPPRRRRSHRVRAYLARELRSLAMAIEVKPATPCPEPAPAR